MFNSVSYIMVHVNDMKKSVEFYRDRLGVPLKFESPGWSEFNTGTTTLALHHTPGSSAALKGPPQPGVCTFGFNVPDLDKTYGALKEKGVHFVMPPTERGEERIKLAICVDPDGLSISLAQDI